MKTLEGVAERLREATAAAGSWSSSVERGRPNPVSATPDEVVRLAEERAARRDARDFAAADAIRERIAALGWRVTDAPDGFRLEPIEPAEPASVPRLRPEQVASVLDRPPTMDATVQWIVEGWPEDVDRGIASFLETSGDRAVQHVVVEVAGTDPDRWGADAEVVALVEGTGWARARNAGLRLSRGRVVLVVDGSIEATGDVFGPLERALADESVGVAGPFGVVTPDLHGFEPTDGPEADGIEGYLMAFRRDMLLEAGLFDEKFRFYRTCDLEYSFRVKDTGRSARVVPVPVRRHEHRMWSGASPEQRERLSKRNFYRFLDRFRGRYDLTVSGEPPQEHRHGPGDHDGRDG